MTSIAGKSYLRSSSWKQVKSDIFFERLSVKGKITLHKIYPKVCAECITKPPIFNSNNDPSISACYSVVM